MGRVTPGRAEMKSLNVKSWGTSPATEVVSGLIKGIWGLTLIREPSESFSELGIP